MALLKKGGRWQSATSFRSSAITSTQPSAPLPNRALAHSSTSLDATSYTSSEEYIADLASRSKLPEGFAVASHKFFFTPAEVASSVVPLPDGTMPAPKRLPMNLTMIMTDEPSDAFAAVFTKNKYPGGPIYVGKSRMHDANNNAALQAIVINNKISNVCPGGGVSDSGVADSEAVCAAVAEAFDLKKGPSSVFPSSTGIIGWRLPVEAMKAAVPSLKPLIEHKGDSVLPAAFGIVTTDRYPKVRSYQSKDGWTLVGIAKGAGMIEPNMATMLSYLLTDLALPAETLSSALQEAVSESYNCISVDADQSTSDTVLLLSSKKKSVVKGEGAAGMVEEFKTALRSVCRQLAEDIVRNGEGTQHVMKVTVAGTGDKELSRGVGKSVINSPLVKCAVAGDDPNVGRIVAAIGSFVGKLGTPVGAAISTGAASSDTIQKLMAASMTITLGGYEIFKDGVFLLDPKKEVLLSDYLVNCQLFPPKDKVHVPEKEKKYPPHERCVEIVVTFSGVIPPGEKKSSPDDKCTVFGSDLTSEYVSINADYRS